MQQRSRCGDVFVLVPRFGKWRLLYPPNVLALQLRPFHVQLVSQSSEEGVSNDDRDAKTPDKCDGIEEVGVARAGVDPQVVEGRSEERCIKYSCGRYEGIAHH